MLSKTLSKRMEDKLIPFGKYKGKPVEILANDKEYTNWLLAQSWFKEGNLTLYNVIINNFREPENTPEHNKMQIKFLNLEYRLKFALYICKNFFEYDSARINEEIEINLSNNDYAYELASALRNSTGGLGIKTNRLLEFTTPSFEKIDVAYSVKYGIEITYKYEKNDRFYDKVTYYEDLKYFNKVSVEIEIKPTISDDFPAVLRQMKASMPNKPFVKSILLVGQYTGIGATESEFIEYFSTQGYEVIFSREIDDIPLPNYDDILIPRDSTKKMVEKILTTKKHCG